MADPINPGGFDPVSGDRIFADRFAGMQDRIQTDEANVYQGSRLEDVAEVVGGAIKYSTLGNIVDATFDSADPTFEHDLDFNPDDMMQAPEVQSLPAEAQSSLRTARSAAEFEHLIEETKEEMKVAEASARLGLTGFALEMAVGLVADLPVDILTGGFGGIASKGSRLSRIMKTAGGMAVTGAAQETFSAYNMNTRGTEDVLYTTLATASLGGAAGAVSGGIFRNASKQELKKLTTEMTENMDRELVGEPVDLEKQIDQAMNRAESAQAHSFDLEDTEVPAGGFSSTGAAAMNDPRRPYRTGQAGAMDDIPTADERVGIDRWGIGDAARIGRSESEYMRGIGSTLLNQSSGYGKDGTQRVVAAVRRERYAAHLDDGMIPVTDAKKAYMKEEGNAWHDVKEAYESEMQWDRDLKLEMNAREFGDKVDYSHVSPGQQKAIMDAADAIDDTHVRQVDLQNATGATDGMPTQRGFFSRRWSPLAVRTLAQGRLGVEGTKKLFKAGLAQGAAKAGLQANEELFTAIADAMVGRFMKMDALDNVAVKKLSMNSKDDILELLEGHNAPDEIMDLIDDFMTSSLEGKTGPKHLRKRATIDVSAKVTGADGSEYMLVDLLEGGIEKTVAQHNRSVAGLSALNAAGYKTPEAAKAAVDQARKEMVDSWQARGFESAAHAEKQANKEAHILTASVDLLMGTLPSELNGKARRALEVVQDFTNIQSLGLMGIPQVAETGRILAANGAASVIQAIPELKNMFRRLANGEVDDVFLKDMEHLVGFRIGDDVKRNPYILREEMGVSYTGNGVPGLYERGMAKAKTFVGKVSLQEYILAAQNKLQMRVTAGRFFDMAMDPTEVNMAQMRELGLEEDVLNQILGHIKKHGSKEKGMQLNKMDPTVRDAFADAVMVANSTQIQKQLVGDMQAWMYNPLGKLLTQFRTFSIGAVDKQSMRWIQSRNKGEQVGTFIYSMAIGSLMYAGKLMLNTSGMSAKDRNKYLEGRLAPAQIAKGAAQMCGQLSLGPEVVGKLGALTGGIGGSVIGRGKGSSTGQSSADVIASIIPAGTTVKRGIDATRGIVKGLSPFHDATKHETKAAIKAAFVADSMIGRTVANVVAGMQD